MASSYTGRGGLSRRNTMSAGEALEKAHGEVHDYNHDNYDSGSDISDEKAPPRDDWRTRKSPVASFAQQRPKPLIDSVTNEWRTNPKYKDEPSSQYPHRGDASPETSMDEFLDRMELFYEGIVDILRSPRFRRFSLYTISLIAFSAYMWRAVLVPHIAETQAARAAFDDDIKLASGGLFGHNSRPSFSDMIHIQTLDPNLVPKSGALNLPYQKSRRLIFVGDIHGCKDELLALLEKVQFNHKRDHLVTAGDMIDKGPDSLGVVDVLRGINASCVRGNHEDRVLLIRGGLRTMLNAPADPDLPVKDQAKSPREDSAEHELAQSLSKEQAAYLQGCPLILRIGNVKAFDGEVVVVHAGLVPGIPLENQDAISAMTMRVIDLSTYMPSRDHERKGFIPWARLWNKVQRLMPREHSRFGPAKDQKPHMTVIYGHDSKRGLQLQQYTKGLDSGCVKGGTLSALVLSEGSRQELIQVKCKDYRPKKVTEANVEAILQSGKPPLLEDKDDDFD